MYSRIILLLPIYHGIKVHPRPWKKLLLERVILSMSARKASPLQLRVESIPNAPSPFNNDTRKKFGRLAWVLLKTLLQKLRKICFIFRANDETSVVVYHTKDGGWRTNGGIWYFRYHVSGELFFSTNRYCESWSFESAWCKTHARLQ